MKPVVAAIDMGYGHLRPATALAEALGTQMLQMDLPPLGAEIDRRFWESTRELYEPLTRMSQLPGVGPPMRALLDIVTAIPPPWPARDLSGATQGTKWMERAAREGVGRALAEHLRSSGAPLLTTFYAAAILAEMHGAERLHCLITDSDINRVWAPPDPARSRIRYFAPTERAARRMHSYGVPRERISVTGYPLPDELVGGRERTALQKNFAARLERLRGKGEAPLIVFAVGGAGAQVPLARKIVQGVKAQIAAGKLRLALVAGRRPEVARALREAVDEAGVEIELHEAGDFPGYLRGLNALLARADALWSKPSEMTFFAALGLPFISAPPVGVHESWNLRWATDRGAALPQHDPAAAGEWLLEWLEDGTLAGAAQSGFDRLPQLGLYEIVSHMEMHGNGDTLTGTPCATCVEECIAQGVPVKVSPMDVSAFDYPLPAELIAQAPLPERDASRLLVLSRASGAVEHRLVRELPQLLQPGDLLVVNDARVIPARLHGRKTASGGKVELLLVEPLAGGDWLALGQASKPLREGAEVEVLGARVQILQNRGGGELVVRLPMEGDALWEFLDRAGEMPLPPYIERLPGELDKERYQTIFARERGAVAAPTAGLHFTPQLLENLKRADIAIAPVTLHVGPGTFLPVRVERTEEHRMHRERYFVPEETAQALRRAKRVVAVGTTALRTLEASRGEPGPGSTDLFITPGYRFQVVQALFTNFHLPKSTLLMLVAAFAGLEPVLAAYREAITRRYRFFSYGDAMLIA